MDAVVDRLWSMVLLLVNPMNMAECGAIACAAFYIVSAQIWRAIIFGVSAPGLLGLLSFIISLELRNINYIDSFLPYLLFPLFENLIFPSFLSGTIIILIVTAGWLRKQPDYRLGIIYIFAIILQCALSMATVYMSHFNDKVE